MSRFLPIVFLSLNIPSSFLVLIMVMLLLSPQTQVPNITILQTWKLRLKEAMRVSQSPTAGGKSETGVLDFFCSGQGPSNNSTLPLQGM